MDMGMVTDMCMCMGMGTEMGLDKGMGLGLGLGTGMGTDARAYADDDCFEVLADIRPGMIITTLEL